MKINFTKKQYAELIDALEIADCIFGTMADFIDEKYKERTKKLTDLKTYLFGFANEFDFEDRIERDGDIIYFKEEEFDRIMDILIKYEEYIFWHELAVKMSHKLFWEKYGKEKIKKMSQDERYLKAGEIEDELFENFCEKGLDLLSLKEVKLK